MAVKILVAQTGAQIIADVKIVENTETGEKVAYWVSHPSILTYRKNEDGNTSVGFGPYCWASDEKEFSIVESFIVSVLEPRKDIAEHWRSSVYDVETQTLEADTES